MVVEQRSKWGAQLHTSLQWPGFTPQQVKHLIPHTTDKGGNVHKNNLILCIKSVLIVLLTCWQQHTDERQRHTQPHFDSNQLEKPRELKNWSELWCQMNVTHFLVFFL